MTPEEVVAACREAGVRLVRFLYCDNGGVVRGKAAHVDRLEDRIRTGIALTVAMQAMNSLDQLQPVEEMGPVGEIRLVPDPSTFTILPYAPRSAAMLRRPRAARRTAVRGRAQELLASHGRPLGRAWHGPALRGGERVQPGS